MFTLNLIMNTCCHFILVFQVTYSFSRFVQLSFRHEKVLGKNIGLLAKCISGF